MPLSSGVKLLMEKVAIFLRKSEAENRFRQVILGSFNVHDFSEIMICSGFFQERGKYYASDCFKSAAPLLVCHRKVSVVGVYNGIWKGDFDRFSSEIGQIKCPCGVSMHVAKRRIKRYHWHAKIFIASDDDGPQLGVIGSSNITSRAFGITKSWNFEADAILWNSANPAADAVMGEIFESVTDNNASSVIVSNYAIEDKVNQGFSLRKRLQDLVAEIEEMSEIVE
tara:strand:+ start:92 stop:766 length:675 start_codon:yes stop_codon:yes gene_type:complete